MNQEIISAIYDYLKDVKPLSSPNPALILKPFNPVDFDKHFISLFGKAEVLKTLGELYNKAIIGMRENDDSYIKGHEKKVYYFVWDKFEKLL